MLLKALQLTSAAPHWGPAKEAVAALLEARPDKSASTLLHLLGEAPKLHEKLQEVKSLGDDAMKMFLADQS